VSLSINELKAKILELLRTDEEFRYAVAGSIGLDAILNELKRLREDFSKRFEEINRRFEDINKRFEEVNRRFEEINKRFEDINRRFEEVNKHFEVIENVLLDHGRRLNRIELELGALNEVLYCRVLWEDLGEEISRKGEKIELRRRNVRIDDEDIDLLIITDKSVYVVEVKVKPKHEDVGRILAKSDVVAKHYKDKEIIPVLAGTMIGKEIEEYAQQKNVKIYNY